MKKIAFFIIPCLALLASCGDNKGNKTEPEAEPSSNYVEMMYQMKGQSSEQVSTTLTNAGFTYQTEDEVWQKTSADAVFMLEPVCVADSGLVRFSAAASFTGAQYDAAVNTYTAWEEYAYRTLFNPISVWGAMLMPEEFTGEGDLSMLDGAYLEAPLLATIKMVLGMQGNTEIVAVVDSLMAHTHRRAEYTDYMQGGALMKEGTMGEYFFSVRNLLSTSSAEPSMQSMGYMFGENDEDSNTYEITFQYMGEHPFYITDFIGNMGGLFKTPIRVR